MPATAKSDGWQEENSLYAQLWEYGITVMALDHFFMEVVEGNVPLTDEDGQSWWNRTIIAERVNHYSKPWCLLFEGLAQMRERIESQVQHSLVEIDANLVMTYHRRGRPDGDPITWTAREERFQMTYRPRDDGLAFSPDQMPLYHGHVPNGKEVRQLVPDCCTEPTCTQRNYNRTVLLTLEKLSQAYAALLLARHAAQRLWNCHSTGHADDCQDPACQFGRMIDAQYATNQRDLGVFVRSLCSILARCATDLTPQWQDFTDTEQFFVGLTHNTTAPDISGEYLAALQDAAVLGDPVEYQRWFRPPPEGEAS